MIKSYTLTTFFIFLLTCYVSAKFQLKEEIAKFNRQQAVRSTQLEIKLREATTPKEIKSYKQAVAQLKHGDYFQFKKVEDLPKNLNWTSGSKLAPIGDPKAIKGGTARMMGYRPPTLRVFGPKANNSMRAKLYDEIGLSFIDFHPVTNQAIPCLAKSWAISADKKTVFFRLNPNAAYSDNKPVEASDYMTHITLRCHDYAKSPYPKMYFTTVYKGLTIYGKEIVAVHLQDRKLELLYYANLSPDPTHFYKDFDQDFITKYDKISPPTTGAYTYNKTASSIEKTVLSRVENWWAKDLPQYKYAYNADHLEYRHIKTSGSDLLKSGEIDIADTSLNDISDLYKNGYLYLTKFKNQYPSVPRGFYLNTAKASLADKHVRIALHYAFNIDKALTHLPHTTRLNQFAEGFGEHSNSKIKARKFSKEKVKFHLKIAGLTTNYEGTWLQQEDGSPLSFTISYNASHKHIQSFMETIQKEALLCGIEIQLNPQSSSNLFKKAIEKEHEIYFGGWGVTRGIPKYHQFFHSSNAYYPNKTIRRQTNNLNSYSNKDLDKLIEQHRACLDKKEMVLLDHKIQQHLHDSAIFIPAGKPSFKLVSSSRWIKWPDTDSMKFSPARVFSPTETYYWWIDQKLEKETKEAIKQNKPFPASLKEVHPILK